MQMIALPTVAWRVAVTFTSERYWVPHPCVFFKGAGFDSPLPWIRASPFEHSAIRIEYHVINYLQCYCSWTRIGYGTCEQICPLPRSIRPDLAAILFSLWLIRLCHQILAFVSLCFQTLPHSSIFRITPIPPPSHSLRTLCQKTGGAPCSCRFPRLSTERRPPGWLPCPPAFPSHVPHRSPQSPSIPLPYPERMSKRQQ